MKRRFFLILFKQNDFIIKFQSKFDQNLRIINELTEIGDTVVRIEQLIQETETFIQSCEGDVKRSIDVIKTGRSIIENNEKTTSKDMIEPKCNELERMVTIFKEKGAKRIENLWNAHRLMERVEKANEWCAKGIDLMASQRVESAMSPESAELRLQEIMKFIDSAEDYELSSLKELKSCQEENNTSLETIILSQVRAWHLF